MRKILFVIAALSLSGALRAARTIPLPAIANETGIAYSKNFDIDINAADVDQVSAQAVYSSATIASQTFQDGRPSTASITVSASNLATLHGAAATDTLTVTSNVLGKAQATNTIYIASNTQTALGNATITINGSVIRTPRDWAILDVASNTAVAIQNAVNAKFGGFTAVASGSTVTITAHAYGVQGNAYTLATSTAAALVAGASTFSGGQENATFTLNGRKYEAGTDWTVGDVSSNTAVNLATFINANFTEVTASTSASTVVTITAAAVGTTANAYTLTEVGGLTAGAALFTGGVIPGYVAIAGTKLVEGTDWTYALTSSGTAKAISDSIMANTTLNAIVSSTWTSGGVVSATTTKVGVATNYALFTNKPLVTPWSSSSMIGGADADWTINTGTIKKASHGFTLAIPVLYSTGAVAIGGLTNQTTYYAIPVTADSFRLAATSTGAVAGSYITLTSSSTAGPHTYTLAPLVLTGTPSFKWQASNDGDNWSDISVSSVTFASPYTAASSTWDFGTYNYRWLRLKYTAGTAGALNLMVTENGKKLYYLP